MPRRENGRLGREKSPLDNFCDPFNLRVRQAVEPRPSPDVPGVAKGQGQDTQI